MSWAYRVCRVTERIADTDHPSTILQSLPVPPRYGFRKLPTGSQLGAWFVAAGDVDEVGFYSEWEDVVWYMMYQSYPPL